MIEQSAARQWMLRWIELVIESKILRLGCRIGTPPRF